jgi:dTDP-glucose pyrophosphorylase
MAMEVVLVCGGTGTRLAGRPAGLPKSMVEVAGEPIVARLARALAGYGPPVFVAARGDAHVPAFVAARHPGAPLVVQPEPDGVASAILLTLPHLRGPALVALGDLVLEGELGPLPPAPALAVWRGAPERAIRANFGVRLGDEGIVTAVVEKPRETAGLLCGLGVYLLTPEVIAAFARAPRDARGELAITTAIAATLDAGYRTIEFTGTYVNVNTAEDLAEAEAALR